jgi:aryl-alcohol dehydrogenase-like predicted oxidoreductase
MEFTQLGRTGLKVSRLCLGTMNFGPQTNEKDSFAIMDRALDLGINFFDTANVYGWKIGEGVTENIVGRWFAQGSGRREKVVIATKVFGRMGDWPNTSRLSAFHIRQSVEGSLKRLQTDHIDLYQMHHIDRLTPWEEIWQAMVTLVQQGKVIYVGSSNFAGWHIAQAQETAKARHFMGLVSEQSLYNLKDRMVELEVVPACKAYGLGLIPWSPLGGGMLGGALQKPRKVAAPARIRRRKSKKTVRSWKPGKNSVKNLARNLRMCPLLGCCTTRLSLLRSSDLAPSTNLPALSVPSRSNWTRPRSRNSTRSGPVPVAKRRKHTRGKHKRWNVRMWATFQRFIYKR